jgi:exodeoxyribonuclease V alpha subunit
LSGSFYFCPATKIYDNYNKSADEKGERRGKMTRKAKIDFLISNIKGVGPAKAEKIADAFYDKENLIDLAYSQEAMNTLKETVGIAAANNIMEQLIDMKRQDEAVQVMVDCGIPYFTAINIAKTELLFKAFKDDPYTIGRQNDVKFEYCDRFAHRLFWENPPDMSRARMKYFIEAMLASLENSGHTFAFLPQLTKKLNQYQKKNEYLPDNYENSTILLYLMHNDTVEVEKDNDLKKWRVYRKATAELENDIAYHIKRLSINKANLTPQPFEAKKMRYDKVQTAAIQSASMSGLKVITGPPGSGKTAVINGIITHFKDMKKDAKIILCAPTGRAAKHMTEITGEEASTIHRLLGISETSQFVKKEKLYCDMVICDEASMLNLDITFELLSRINTGTVVYFVGDKDQLPAVGPGNVLHDIINSGVVPVYQLTKVYRQDGIILENAHEINMGIVPTRTSAQYQTFTFDNAEKLREQAINWFKEYYDPDDPFETQILVPSYKTACGITALNEAIQELNPEHFVYRSNAHKCAYKKNDKVLMTKNNKDGLYQNGSVGIFVSNLGDEIVVNFDGEDVTLDKSAIEDMTLGYAMSVHKSQGSEYKHVLLCLPDKPENMLKRNIVYTAATRAKCDLTILEMRGAMAKAVDTNLELFMQTGLKNKLISSIVR